MPTSYFLVSCAKLKEDETTEIWEGALWPQSDTSLLSLENQGLRTESEGALCPDLGRQDLHVFSGDHLLPHLGDWESKRVAGHMDTMAGGH